MSARALAALVVAAALGAGLVAGSQSYALHKRQIALARLIDEACDACTLRHAGQAKLRELLRQKREAAQGADD